MNTVPFADFEIYTLSDQFRVDYPVEQYPEYMAKNQRPHDCLLVEKHEEYFICVPFRSNIQHNNAFLFKNFNQKKRPRPGLDFSKMLIIKDCRYLSDFTGTIDAPEYAEMKRYFPVIVKRAVRFQAPP